MTAHPPALDDLPVSVFRFAPGDRVLYANRRVCDQLGVTPAAVAGIVRGLRGSIAVESVPDRGTTVTVELPAGGGG